MNLEDVKRGGSGHARRKRVGRGRSGKGGGTCGRGHKGYGSRSGRRSRFAYEGGQTPYFRRLPKRGFSNAPFTKRNAIVNVGDLTDPENPNRFSSGDTVNLQTLMEKRLIRKKLDGIKVLGQGVIEIPLTVEANRFSESAVRKIRDAGGEVKIV